MPANATYPDDNEDRLHRRKPLLLLLGGYGRKLCTNVRARQNRSATRVHKQALCLGRARAFTEARVPTVDRTSEGEPEEANSTGRHLSGAGRQGVRPLAACRGAG